MPRRAVHLIQPKWMKNDQVMYSLFLKSAIIYNITEFIKFTFQPLVRQNKTSTEERSAPLQTGTGDQVYKTAADFDAEKKKWPLYSPQPTLQGATLCHGRHGF